MALIYMTKKELLATMQFMETAKKGYTKGLDLETRPAAARTINRVQEKLITHYAEILRKEPLNGSAEEEN